ncbi:MAG: ribosome maturation factor RimP [Acutalibacteraceae bacterium]
MKVTEQVAQFAEPVVQAHGCTLWDVEYVREGGEWFLRLYIDKDGGVDISDCEAISRALDPILDEKDPVPDSYNFEVCSAGLERQLKRPSDFAAVYGQLRLGEALQAHRRREGIHREARGLCGRRRDHRHRRNHIYIPEKRGRRRCGFTSSFKGRNLENYECRNFCSACAA